MNRYTPLRLASAAVGSTAILLGLRQRGSSRVLSVAAGSGLLAYGALASSPLRSTERGHHQPVNLTSVITIGKPREELYRKLRDAQMMLEVFGDDVQVSSEGEGRIRVLISLPGRQKITWTSRLIEQDQGSSFLWRTDPGASVPHDMFIRLRDARPSEWGTVVTLGISPLSDGTLTNAFVRLTGSLDRTLLTRLLRRFKSLVETGEMPTLSRNPAGRHRAFAAV